MLHGMPLGPWRKILFDQLDWILRPEQSLWCSIRLALRLWRSACRQTDRHNLSKFGGEDKMLLPDKH